MITVTAEQEMTVEELLKKLELPEDDAGIVSVNGKAVKRDHALHKGDIVKVFPVITGG